MRKMSIGEWLASVGLVQYAELFDQNRIELDVLTQLTEQDLKELGIPLGDRKRLLLGISAGRVPTAIPDVARGTSQHPSVSSEAERRQLTVMFCDLVGSTVLSRELDPEQLRELMRAYQQACRSIIEKYAGHVAQYLGDGLMVYFGWPRAHEDDAERSVRASLEIVNAVKGVQAPAPLQVRIGIATGPVVVGETGAGDASVPKLAVGETPNLAARLQGIAGADEIVIGPSTQRLLAAAFEYQDLGKHTLKGIVEPVHALRVLGLGKAEGRFEATHVSGLTPLVGREEEIALLLRRWEEAKTGDGQVVLLAGEPGIGKSRIARILRERLEGQSHFRMRYQCSPFHTQSALYPIIEHLERSAGFTREDRAEDKFDKLEALLRQGVTQAEFASVAPLFASLLSMPADRYPPLNYSPQKQKERTLEVLTQQVAGLSKRQPLLMVFEDVHWLDPTTQELLDLLVARIAQLPVLLVLTYRLEYIPRWSGEPHVTPVTLSRLNRKLGAQLAANITGGKAMPKEVLEQILLKTDGVPLFVEELTKAVLESGLVRLTDYGYELNGPLTLLAIPSTLQDSLMARLDRLSEVREVAQTGACIGREFPHDLLSAVSSLPEDKLQAALEQLVGAELIFRRGTPPNATYTFKHALVQDAAYDSLLKSKRVQLHAELAQALESDFRQRVEHEPELLAHHFTQAKLHARAVPYWVQAGQRALAKVALAEAVGHLSAALMANELLPPGIERDTQELDVRLLLGAAYLASLGWAAIEVVQAMGPARDLAVRLRKDDKLVAILFYVWFHHMMRCEYARTWDIVTELRALAQSGSDSTTAVIAGLAEALTCWFTGNPQRAREAAEAMLEVYEPQRHGQLALTYIHDPKCLMVAWAAEWLWALGYPEQARRAAEEQLRLARQLGHPMNLFVSLSVGTVGLTACGETRIAREWLQEAKIIAEDLGIAFMANAIVPFWDGCALIAAGEHELGNTTLLIGAKGWRDTGPLHLIPLANMMRARALTALSRFEEAQRLLDETLDIIERTGHRSHEPEVHRTLGALQLKCVEPDPVAAERSFLKALEASRAQNAKGYELRAAASLARLWQSQGRREDARQLLLATYSWFTEGFDSKDVTEARALIDELS